MNKTSGNFTNNTKSDILIIAREIMYKDGYEKLSMRKIASRLGFTATSLYYHFKNKEELVLELVHESRLRMAQFINNRLKKLSNPIEIVIESFVSYIDYGLQNPEDYKIMFMLPYPGILSDRLKAIVTDKIEPGILDLAKRIEEINPEHKNNSVDLAHALWMMSHGYISTIITSREDIVYNQESVYKYILKIIKLVITSPFNKK